MHTCSCRRSKKKCNLIKMHAPYFSQCKRAAIAKRGQKSNAPAKYRRKRDEGKYKIYLNTLNPIPKLFQYLKVIIVIEAWNFLFSCVFYFYAIQFHIYFSATRSWLQCQIDWELVAIYYKSLCNFALKGIFF